jgi:hypothetical protein
VEVVGWDSGEAVATDPRKWGGGKRGHGRVVEATRRGVGACGGGDIAATVATRGVHGGRALRRCGAMGASRAGGGGGGMAAPGTDTAFLISSRDINRWSKGCTKFRPHHHLFKVR